MTFRGSKTVTLQPGQVIVTDPIEMKVRRLRDLVVSVYVPDATYPPMHVQTYVTQYLTQPGAGDHSADLGASAFKRRQQPIYWLDGLFTRSRARQVVVAIGDSVTDGEQAPGSDDFGIDRHPTWPDHLAQRLSGNKRLAGTGVINQGENGDWTDESIFGPSSIDSRLRHDVLALPGVTHVVLEAGGNDALFGRDARTIIANLKRIANRLHKEDLKVIGATIVPIEDFVLGSEAKGAVRDQVNDFIRTSKIFDGTLDIARIVGQEDDDGSFRPRYDSGDHLHPNTAGYKAIANGLALRLLR